MLNSNFNLNEIRMQLNSNEAILIVSSPRQIQNIVNRPLTYGFDESFVDNMSENVVNSTEGKRTLPIDVKNYIEPSSIGMPVNTASLCNNWQFVLIVNIKGAYNNYNNGRIRRLVTYGYFIKGGEPINPTTMYMSEPTFNPNAIMQFTHSTLMEVYPDINGTGTKLACNYDTDNVIPAVKNFYKEGAMYSIEPGDIRSGNLIYGAEECIDTGDNIITGNRTESLNIDTSQNSPASHANYLYSNLASAAQNGLANDVLGHHMLSSRPQSVAGDTFYDCIRSTFDASVVSNTKAKTINMGIDTTRSLSMSELINTYPNITIIPCKVSKSVSIGEFDERPQIASTFENIMSALVADVLTGTMVKCGLSEIAFRYMSWDGSSVTTSNLDTWEIIQASEIVYSSNPTKQSALLNVFKSELEYNLFPMLKSINHFNLFVKFNVSGDSIIDLQYMDRPQQGGVYIHRSKLGGLVNPLIANKNTFEHNATNLRYLINGVAMNVSGKLHQPVESLNPPEYKHWDNSIIYT